MSDSDWREAYDLKPVDSSPQITVHLDNLDHDDGMVTVHVQAPGAAKWAKEDDQSIMGSHWEADGADFAYAVISDGPDLVEKLEAEGYTINEDNYSAPDAPATEATE